MDIKPYNPLDKLNLGSSVADALLDSETHPLGEVAQFNGAGIYAIYYVGDLPVYSVLAARNKNNQFSAPIYVGKAVPPGARKGNFGLDSEPGSVLFKRLREHADSIRLATNLNIDDFYCRFLVVEDIWIPLGESLLIAKFSPVWNQLLDGFGNHDPGGGRYGQARSKWDTLHPGRAWALRCAERVETQEQIERELMAFLAV